MNMETTKSSTKGQDELTSELRDGFYLATGTSVLSETSNWYRNIQFLGKGGSAATFLVICTTGENRGIPFALKVFQRRTKPERRESLITEAKFLRTCRHPAVMQVFDQGIYAEEHPFFVAEYLPKTLRQAMDSGSLSLTEKLLVATQLVSGLVYLAGLPVPAIHRDLKPQNIFLKGRAAVLGDFGLLKRVDEQTEEDLEFIKESIGIGMARFYRTPDLVEYFQSGKRPTPKSDVFQLGLVLTELFTGRNPLLWSKDALSPLELGDIWIYGKYAEKIRRVLWVMLNLNPDRRPNALVVQGYWDRILKEVVFDQSHLSGRALDS